MTRHAYVVGNSRSGTTMTARLLGRHPDVLTLPELHFLEELWTPGQDAAVDPQALADRLLHHARNSYHQPWTAGGFGDEPTRIVAAAGPDPEPWAVFRAVLDHEAAAAGASAIIEQTPRNAFYVSALLADDPDTVLVLNMVRDPRDVALSKRNWWRRTFRGSTGVPWRTTLRRWADYHPVTSALLWRAGVQAPAGIEDPRVVTIRFEDLLTDPEATLAPALTALGIELDPTMLEVPRISSSNAVDRDDRGLDASVVGRWRDGLSPTEAWICERLVGATMRRHGYEPEVARPSLVALIGWAVVLPVKLGMSVALNAGRSRRLGDAALRRLRAARR